MNNVLFVKSLQLIAFGNNHSGRFFDEMRSAIIEYLDRLIPSGRGDFQIIDTTKASSSQVYTITLFNKKETSAKLSGDSVDTLEVKPFFTRDGYSDDFTVRIKRSDVYFGEGSPKVLYCGTMLFYEKTDLFRVYSHELHGKRIETGSQSIHFRNDYDPTELREEFGLTTERLDMQELRRYIMLAYARDSIIEKIFLIQCFDKTV